MAQDTFGDFDATSSNNTTIEGDATDGAVSVAEGNLPSTINNAVRSIMAAANTSFGDLPAGAARPSYLTANRYWRDTGTAGKQIIKFYDGTDDITIMTIDTSANSVTFGSGFLANVVEDTTPQLGGNLDLNGNGLTFPGATVTDVTGADTLAISGTAGTNGDLAQWNVDGDLVDGPTPPSGTIVGTTDSQALTNKSFTELPHTGDANNKLAFGTDTQDFQTGGLSRLDISDTGVRLGGANARVTEFSTDGTLAGNSDTAVSTEKAVKTYVDTEVASAGGSMVFIASQDASASATLDFTGFDATKYDAYVFELQNVKPATNQTALYLRTSTDGGVGYDSGSGAYQFAVQRLSTGVARDDNANSSSTEINLTGTPTGDYNVGSAAGEDGVSGTLRIHGPHLAKETQVTADLAYTQSGGFLISAVTAGQRKAAEDVNAVQFLFNSGNIASGTITMYGLKNS